jgi:two-component system cell cycle sensor histidine kinase/response regulator CckA
MGDASGALGASGESAAVAYLAAIVESSDDAIIGKTLDGVITSWNAGAAAMYGYSAAEMIGRSLAMIVPPDRAGEVERILQRIRRGERVQHFGTRRVCKDGRLIDVSLSVSAIRDAGGTVLGAATVARDMTESNRAEADRRAMDRRLSQSERMETLGNLAGGIAHDFNNVLGAIVGYAELMAAAAAGSPQVRADAERIRAEAQRAARLTKQLLIFSQRDLATPEIVDFNAIIADVHDLLSASIGGNIELRIDLAAGLPAIEVNRSHVEQVLLNLAFNARDAMPQGGTLTIGTDVAEDSTGLVGRYPGIGSGRFVELAVTDTGTGMSPEILHRIFEPFFTTKPLGRGTGLGLATVFGIATSGAGGVSVDSEEGVGTTFRVCFPAASAPAPAMAGTRQNAVSSAKGNGEVILVVDDEPALREVCSRILRREGYVAIEAESPEQALLLVSSRDIQLLLTDSMMPVMSGPALAVRASELNPGLRVLHMSGYSAGVLSAQGIQEGEVAFLEKPFTAEALLKKVSVTLSAPPAA